MANSSTLEQAAQHRLDVTAHLRDAISAATVSGDRGVALRSVPFLAQIGIRTALNTPGAAALEAALGLNSPTHVGGVSAANGNYVLWQSPDEFLLVSEPNAGAVVDAAQRTAALAEALGENAGSVIDLSANRVLFEVSGPSAQLLLEKACAIDLHPRTFTSGMAIQTGLGKVPVFVWKHEDERFYLLARSSFAEYLIHWLIDGMSEYAVPEVG